MSIISEKNNKFHIVKTKTFLSYKKYQSKINLENLSSLDKEDILVQDTNIFKIKL